MVSNRLLILALSLAVAGQSVAADTADFDAAKGHVAALAKQGSGKARRAKNVILFVGD